MSNIDNLQGLDKAAILFQVLGESLALSMFQNIAEADIMRIRIRSKELTRIPITGPRPASSIATTFTIKIKKIMNFNSFWFRS